MHQIIYIESDEEVNSVISRLKKSPKKQIVLAIPQRALILQSAVNLKMIKKASDKAKKKVMVVSRDENGLSLAKKIGFFIKDSLEGLEKDQTKLSPSEKPVVISNSPIPQKTIAGITENKKNRLKSLGSETFFDNQEKKQTVESKDNPLVENNTSSQPLSKKEKAFQDLFVNNHQDISTEKGKEVKNVLIGKKARLLFWFLGIGVVGIAICAILYLFLPTATVKIYPQKNDFNFTVNAVVSDNTDWESDFADTLSLQLFSLENEDSLTLSQETTGESSSSKQKASGKITVYNEYSEADQILVSTTRFLSADGKLFRSVKTVTVPGVKIANGEKKPGEIEVSVIADKSGEDYNIEPTSFSIPGFKGSKKYEKFYAKSFSKMKGGGTGNTTFKSVTEQDVAKIKEKTTKKAEEKMTNLLKSNIGTGKILLDKAVSHEIINSSYYPEIGSLADKFEYQIKLKSSALAFSEKELEEKIIDYIQKNILPKQVEYDSDLISLKKNFDITAIDFSEKNLKINIDVNASYIAKIDTEKLTNEILGKNYNELESIVAEFAGIEKIETTINPGFLANKIPRYKKRIKIEVIK